ncbi:TolB family protein [Parapedobacter sp. DT-150]|uniref:TolB family protein n=1 Tax=Parapedobacter sp. DT-150 TaxID=3396162 RepID=UPI003F19416A
MNTKTKTVALALIAAFGVLSCAKDDDTNPDGGVSPYGLTGKLIYTFTSNVYQLDLQTNRQSTYFTYNTYGFNNWDMSWDEQFRLTNEREGGVFDVAKITLVRNEDGAIVDEFDYDSPYGNDTDTEAFLSPDNAKVVYNPTFDNGIVITDLDGNLIIHLESVTVGQETVAFGISDEVLWLPDNSLLFTLDNRYILRAAPPYTSLSLVKDMPYTQWGNLRVNRQGTQLAMMVSNHIYVMDIDGNDLRQVTESSGGEIHADFSPDGEHLLVAKKIGPTFFYWNLAVVPNDGQVYNMDDSEAVMIIKPEGENTLPAVDGGTFWIE